jgi:fluoride ion exporter CrcB/FEX
VGAFTTFSTLILESTRLVEANASWLAAVYVTGSVAAGFAALLAGALIGRSVAT